MDSWTADGQREEGKAGEGKQGGGQQDAQQLSSRWSALRSFRPCSAPAAITQLTTPSCGLADLADNFSRQLKL
eukprot:746836-Hanusia_phi.AAC.2